MHQDVRENIVMIFIIRFYWALVFMVELYLITHPLLFWHFCNKMCKRQRQTLAGRSQICCSTLSFSQSWIIHLCIFLKHLGRLENLICLLIPECSMRIVKQYCPGSNSVCKEQIEAHLEHCASHMAPYGNTDKTTAFWVTCWVWSLYVHGEV